MAVGGAQGGVLHLCAGFGVGGHHKARLTQFDVVEVQQVAVTGRSLHHIVHSAHCHQTARHNAQTDESDDGPAQESENGMAVLFFLLLRPAGLTDPPVLLRCGPLLPERTITVESPSFIV